MKFGEKVKKLRKEAHLSQAELAKQIGVTVRTVQSYEANSGHPKQREIYYKLADIFHCDVNYLLTEEEEFISSAGEQYGPRGAKQAANVLDQVQALFAGGELSDDDQLAFITEIQQLYLDSKKRARKFTPHSHHKDSAE